jgi:uncharacterized membrane protein
MQQRRRFALAVVPMLALITTMIASGLAGCATMARDATTARATTSGRRAAAGRVVEERIAIVGEVARPGVYPYVDGMRVSDALREAGGPTPNANRIVVRRTTRDGVQTIRLAGPSALTPERDVLLTAGDEVLVPPASLN